MSREESLAGAMGCMGLWETGAVSSFGEPSWEGDKTQEGVMCKEASLHEWPHKGDR